MRRAAERDARRTTKKRADADADPDADAAAEEEDPAGFTSSSFSGVVPAGHPPKKRSNARVARVLRVLRVLRARVARRPGRSPLVPGHWIDPGEETGAAGERRLNLAIADAAEATLTRAAGGQSLRPDRDASPPLQWDEYCAWVRERTLEGVAVVEIHGQGEGAEMGGRVTGVIAQRAEDDESSDASGLYYAASPLGAALERRFGTFPMHWSELAVPRLGGAVVESFDATYLSRLGAGERARAVRGIADDIVEAVEEGGRPDAHVGRRFAAPSGCAR